MTSRKRDKQINISPQNTTQKIKKMTEQTPHENQDELAASAVLLLLKYTDK